ncbi:HNH endonuclease signature motif containing protein [Nocardioides euryhalodurans]|uniref:HNH endonuclease n=1 Tax=Nocardioides euryhalodurans TaxID=2518370 RepID=A0A4P7GKR0_9ACTN|nr:HNH endonuclease signature motif containing protein [Nocardioides euryhalodurans]QBR92261.1 HNH endonuclease [Nocardioides euryhalodurans]
MSQAAVPLPHPLQRCASRITAAIDEIGGSSPLLLTTEAKQEVLVDLSRSIARLEAVRLSVLAAAGDVADEAAARSAGAWLGVRARLHGLEGRRLQQLAEALAERYAVVGSALLAGDVSRPQAEVIVAALDDLPGEVDRSVRTEAERHLAASAADFGPRDLRVLGRRVLDVVAPEVAEEHERRALGREEQRAQRRMRLTTRLLGGGLTRVVADLPTLHADLLLTQLHAFASPRRDHLDGAGSGGARRDPDTGERIPASQLLAQAFCSLLERLPTGVVPDHGGGAATLVVTIDHDKLAEDLGVARLSTGHAISVGEARRLACTAGILPMVLGGASHPLDVCRKRRFHTPAMRRALAVRDRECRALGCDIPAAWCEAHHAIPWAEARGPTSVEDGLLLCSFHHHRAHDKRYDLRRMTNGDVRFARRR